MGLRKKKHLLLSIYWVAANSLRPQTSAVAGRCRLPHYAGVIQTATSRLHRS